MADTDASAYRRRYRADPGEVEVRESDEIDSGDGVFEIRMPIASAGEVRNSDDDPLTREQLRGMAQQLGERAIGVFPAHGADTMISGDRYSPFERLGDWRGGEVVTREEDEDVLMATARMPDPETLPDLGAYREALGILKEQAERGIAQDASIGWRDDEAFPGGVDLMEASIVGIGADWRTNTDDEAAEVVTQAALDAGAERDGFLANVRAALRGGRPLGPEDDPNRFDDWDDCIEAMQDSGHSQAEAERICGSFKEETEAADADTSDTDTQDHDMTDSETADEPTDEQDAADDADTQAGDEATEQVRQSPAEIADMAEDYVMGAVEGAIDDLREDLEDMMGDGGENETDEDGDEMDDDEDDEEQAADEPDSEQDSADTDGERDGGGADELRAEIESLREELDKVREGGVSPDDVDTPEAETEQDADDGETNERDTTEDPTAGLGNYR